MKFRARTAGAGFAHHPEIVFDVAVNDLDFRIATRRAEKFCPDVVSFLIEISGIAGFRCVNRCVKPVRRKPPPSDDEFPCPLDGFFFEIVSERPVPEHFEKRVVIGVVADVLEVVVFSASTYAFLGVSRARWIVGSFFDAEEIRHKGIHPRIGEKQARRLRQQRRGGHDGVLFFSEKIEEGLADFRGGHGAGREVGQRRFLSKADNQPIIKATTESWHD